jgi:hypothetical protein
MKLSRRRFLSMSGAIGSGVQMKGKWLRFGRQRLIDGENVLPLSVIFIT